MNPKNVNTQPLLEATKGFFTTKVNECIYEGTFKEAVSFYRGFLSDTGVPVNQKTINNIFFKVLKGKRTTVSCVNSHPKRKNVIKFPLDALDKLIEREDSTY